MSITRRSLLHMGGYVLCGALGTTGRADAPSPAEVRLKSLLPTADELHGFVQKQRDTPPLTWEQTHIWSDAPIPGDVLAAQRAQLAQRPVEDKVSLNRDLSELRPEWSGQVSSFNRLFRTPDNIHRLSVGVQLFAPAEMARAYLANTIFQIATPSQRRRYTGPEPLGEETFINGGQSAAWIHVRCGAVLIKVECRQTQAARLANVSALLPGEALEAVAHLILYRVARHAEFTGVPARSLRLTVNGRALPDPVLELQDTVYVPLRPLARLLNLPHAWEAKTGRLRLERPGQPAVDLQAGSFRAVPAAGPERTLSAPVLKEGEQPVLALADLLTLLGGRISQRENAALHVTL